MSQGVTWLWQDLRYGLRILMKDPGFTLVAVLTLALGIGANTAMFSVVNAVLLRPLPYPESDRLTWVWVDNRVEGIREYITSWPNFADWRAQNQVFEGMAGVREQRLNLTGVGEPEELQGANVSANFFELMRSGPARGRGFLGDEEYEGRDLVVVISHNLWQRRFGGDQNIVGQTLYLDGQTHNVIGVMPPYFQFPNKTEIWKPLVASAELRRNRGALWLPVIGRRWIFRSGGSIRLSTFSDIATSTSTRRLKKLGTFTMPLLIRRGRDGRKSL
jgi:putative ABC transport system permease protein